MNIMEELLNEMIPIYTKFTILVAIVICLVSFTIAIYSLIKRKHSLKEIGKCLKKRLGVGVLVGISGALINYITYHEIIHDFSSYKRDIPVGYIISLLMYIIFMNVRNKDK